MNTQKKEKKQKDSSLWKEINYGGGEKKPNKVNRKKKRTDWIKGKTKEKGKNEWMVKRKKNNERKKRKKRKEKRKEGEKW